VRVDHHGVPRLVDAVAFLLSAVVDARPVGDHALVTCEVLEVTCDHERRPLVFFGGAFGSFAA
jgi:flavin reductase (DIM6/NTAB) family NADH-FMN oxidoreductase RutF